MKKVVILITIGLVTFLLIQYKPVFLLKELEDFREEASNSPSKSREYSIVYRYEDKIDSLIEFGNIARATELLDSLILEYNGYSDSWYFRKGQIEYLNKGFDEAISYFSQAITKSSGKNLKSYLWRSYSYAKMGSCESALQDINHVISINPNFNENKMEIESICKEYSRE